MTLILGALLLLLLLLRAAASKSAASWQFGLGFSANLMRSVWPPDYNNYDPAGCFGSRSTSPGPWCAHRPPRWRAARTRLLRGAIRPRGSLLCSNLHVCAAADPPIGLKSAWIRQI